MQFTLQKGKPFYFNIYNFVIKPFSLVICCFLFACSEQKEIQQVLSTESPFQSSTTAININAASAEELKKLPHIGTETAQEIIEHREKYGKFRKPEHLLLIRRISDKRFREIRSLIKVE